MPRRLQRRIPYALVGVTITLLVAALAGPPAAQGSPACDEGPGVGYLKGLPDTLIYDRFHDFSVDEDHDVGWISGRVAVTMSDASKTFADYTVDAGKKLYIMSNPGDSPLTVTATFSEYRWEGDGNLCSRTLTKTMGAKTGATLSTPRVGVKYGTARFELAAPSRCLTDYAPTPVMLMMKRRGTKTWTKTTSVDQCYGWYEPKMRGSQFRLARKDNGRSMNFIPRTPRRNGTTVFRYRLVAADVHWPEGDGEPTLTARRTIKRGSIRIRTTHYPRERVYAYKPDGSINDRYWNYCVNRGKQVWMHNGNPYCVEPAFTHRKASVR